MDELSEKLSALLSDPDGMEQIKNMAQSLLGGKTEQPSPSVDEDIDIGAITRILKMLKQGGADDSRIKLLSALKPNLSPEKQGKVDTAIKMLKLAELAPLLKNSGFLDF